jgi:hypothetical protein
MPVVRSPSRRGRDVLCVGLQELEDHQRICLSWQIVPTVLPEMLKDHESQKAQRAMEAMLRTKKIDIRVLERAVAGEGVSA